MALSRPDSANESFGFGAVLKAAAENPRSVGVFSDMDGTLSNLIEDPSAVVPVEGAVDQIRALSERCGRVAVVSGRPVSFLEQFFGAPAELSGLYGIEHLSSSGLAVDPAALQWQPVLAQIAADAVERFGPAAVEDKTYSLTLHYRRLAEPGRVELVEWVTAIAHQHGLHAREAKMSMELHPPIDTDKGAVLGTLFAGLDAAVYFGDDVGDRSAFERICQAVDSGALKAGAGVLVNGPETPSKLTAIVTDEVRSPGEVVELLGQLVAAVS